MADNIYVEKLSSQGAGEAGKQEYPGAAEDMHGQVIKYFRDWEEATSEHNKESMRDRDYYDGIQWSAADRKVLADRNQPVITINRIAPKVNYVLGVESEQKTDPQAYPRTPYHEEDAQAITDMLRYLDDKNNFERLSSEVAEDVFVEGLGGEVFGVTPVRNQYTGAVTYDITETKVPWHQFWYDPHSKQPDFSDAFYMGTAVWWDYDEACADPRYQEHKDVLEAVMQGHGGTDDTTEDRPHDWFDSSRRRILILECYYRKHDEETDRMEWYGCHFTGGGFLIDPFRVPFVDENGRTWCPIWMTSAFVSGRFNYRYGMVRQLISPQDEINKRRSKLMHLLNSRQVAAEDGVFQDPQKAQAELAKPDGFIRLTRNALKEERFQVLQTADLAQGQLNLLQESKMEIDTLGPHAALIASESHKLSGRAFLAQQQAGVMEIKPVFDHLKEWKKGSYRRKWWLTKQYMTEETWFRIQDTSQGYRFVALNKKQTKLQRLMECLQRRFAVDEAMSYVFGPMDGPALTQAAMAFAQQQQMALQQQAQRIAQTGQQVQAAAQQGMNVAGAMEQVAVAMQQTQAAMQSFNPQQVALQWLSMQPQAREPFTANNVAQLDVDIIIDTAPHSVIVEHEQYQELSLMAQKGMLGQPVSPDVMEMIIQASSLRDKKKLIGILKRPPPPEVVQAQQAQQQAQMAMMSAQVAETQANALLLRAKAEETQAKTSKVPAETRHEESSAVLNIAKAQAVPVETEIKAQQVKVAAMDAGAKSVAEKKDEPSKEK